MSLNFLSESEVPNTNLKGGEWDMQKALQNGVVLCKSEFLQMDSFFTFFNLFSTFRVAKKMKPELIPNIQENPKQSFKCKENINYFIRWRRKFAGKLILSKQRSGRVWSSKTSTL